MLALALGMTLGELGRRVSAAEMATWRVFFALYPFGEAGHWLRAGVVAATVANSAPFRGKDSKPAQPGEMMLPLPGTKRPGRKRPQLDVEQTDGLLKGIAERAKKGGRHGRGAGGGTIQGG